jgi:ElaB/YqjD/DUF883 family membrane-anchored ribosome-binding protein
MSKVTNRESVRTVSQQLQEDLQDLTRELEGSLETLQSSTRNVLEDIRSEVKSPIQEAGSLMSASALVERQETIRAEIRQRLEPSVSETEAVRAETLGSMQVISSLPIEAARHVEETLAQLSMAESVTEARALQSQALKTLQQGHRQVFMDNLTLSVENACLATGFLQVNVSEGPDGDTRIAATNEKGQAIVSEIREDGDGEPSLASEVLGVFDNSCEDILERFDEALAEQGVHVGGEVAEQHTRGQYVLDASRDFVRQEQEAPAQQRDTAEQKSDHQTDHARRRRRARQAQRRQQKR